MDDTTNNKLVCLCAIAGAFGIQGLVRLKPFTADPLSVADYGPLRNNDGSQNYTLSKLNAIKGGVSARIKGVDNRNQAEALRGVRLYVPRASLPDLEEDEFYYSDLLGLSAEDLQGNTLGKIKAVQDHGAGDVIEINGPDGVFDIPFTKAAVPYVDIAGGKLIVDLPETTEDT